MRDLCEGRDLESFGWWGSEQQLANPRVLMLVTCF